MLRPYSRLRSSRPRCAVDDWLGPEWTLLERHEIAVAAPPATALAAMTTLRLRELPAVRALFTLRRLRYSADMTFRDFFSAAPFVQLAEVPGREFASGVLLPDRRGEAVRCGPPASPAAFGRALQTAPFAAVATFRADPTAGGSLLWTETWARTRGARARLAFGAYWLAIGPWSALIRTTFLKAARARAQRAARSPRA